MLPHSAPVDHGFMVCGSWPDIVLKLSNLITRFFFCSDAFVCCAAVYALQFSQHTAAEGLAACVSLILDILDEVLCSLETPSVQQTEPIPMCPAHPEDAMDGAWDAAKNGPEGFAAGSAQPMDTEPQCKTRMRLADSAIFWGLKILVSSTKRCPVADRQVQAFVIQQAGFIATLSIGIRAALQELLVSVQDGHRIGLAVFANAQAAVLEDTGSSDPAAALSSFLQHICSSASIFELESHQIAVEIRKRENAQQETEGTKQPGISCCMGFSLQTDASSICL